jgi:hypothetical protein
MRSRGRVSALSREGAVDSLIAITGTIGYAPSFPRLPGKGPGYRECLTAFRERTDRQACLPLIALGLPVAREPDGFGLSQNQLPFCRPRD